MTNSSANKKKHSISQNSASSISNFREHVKIIAFFWLVQEFAFQRTDCQFQEQPKVLKYLHLGFPHIA
ncbi:hypothetical protein BpHYR1_033195 [Brachionus plicatilis]|uniref:Uncharacterized protein n=1 Tax=Brachionus plicatilis TaxID=10195 RepID=A0A3M7QNY8_BRAPC|nr:hypothetical protein BpHYR1_033195 [Brachionus plicatilis]